MKELSEIHVILGISKFSKLEVMNKPHSPIEEKNQRQKRFKLEVHLGIGELEFDLTSG